MLAVAGPCGGVISAAGELPEAVFWSTAYSGVQLSWWAATVAQW